MKTMRQILISIGFTIFVLSKFPNSSEMFNRFLTPPKDFTCNELIPMLSQNVITLRVINRSQFDPIENCLSKYASENHIILIADKHTENNIVEEMMRQSELPTDPASFIKIGQMLAPSHLLIVNQIKVNLLFNRIEYGLYQIKTGKVLSKGNIVLSFYDHYFDFIKAIINYLILFSVILAAIKVIESPIHRYFKLQKERIHSYSNYKHALNLIKSDNLLDGTDLLISVAHDKINGGASYLALEKLRKIKNNLEY